MMMPPPGRHCRHVHLFHPSLFSFFSALNRQRHSVAMSDAMSPEPGLETESLPGMFTCWGRVVGLNRSLFRELV